MRIIATTAAALLLAGCSSGAVEAGPDLPAAAASSSGVPAAAAAAPLDVEALTLPEVADLIGCDQFAPQPDGGPFAREYATCEGAHGRVQLYRFGTPEAMANMWEVAAEYGSTPDQGVTKGLLLVVPQDRDLAAVRDAIG